MKSSATLFPRPNGNAYLSHARPARRRARAGGSAVKSLLSAKSPKATPATRLSGVPPSKVVRAACRAEIGRGVPMSIAIRLFLGLALSVALLAPAIANDTMPFVATSSCTLPTSFAPSLNCTSNFTVPDRKTWAINFLSYYCTSDSQVPNILVIQFTTNEVSGTSYFNGRDNFFNYPPTVPTQYYTFGTVKAPSIYADPHSTISVTLQFFPSTASNTVCDFTLGGLVVDE
jgi:hypothetical protein